MDRFRNTVLHNAANQGDEAALRRLLSGPSTTTDALHLKRLDLEAVGKGGWTPLEVAVYKGHAPIVALLLSAGARVRPRALGLAREYDQPQILAQLLATTSSVPEND
jgi:ankyrin repeat protein